MLNYLLIVLFTYLTRPYIRHEKKKQLEQVGILHNFFWQNFFLSQNNWKQSNWAMYTLAYIHMHVHMHSCTVYADF